MIYIGMINSIYLVQMNINTIFYQNSTKICHVRALKNVLSLQTVVKRRLHKRALRVIYYFAAPSVGADI